MGPRMKKYRKGEAVKFISRAQALKKLQLNLKDFRRLCILKGIYPREPKNRTQAQKGSSVKKTLYYTKDIRFLMHEPLIWKFRQFKVFMRKVKTAIVKGDFDTANRLKSNKPSLQLDHLVKERYPTFNDALHDLDDCLTLCFFYASQPRSQRIPGPLIALCRRLTVEFLHYVIESRSLRKVFISIKGIYYQVEIKGQIITWIVPHQRGYQPQSSHDIDFKIMTTFVDFYTTMLGFVNFRLYHSLNLVYPPKLPGITVDEEISDEDSKDHYNELVAALNQSLVRTFEPSEEDPEVDEFPDTKNADKLDEAKKEAQRIEKLKQLFKGLKFYVGREVPRESIVFIVRACGGEVSWDSSIFPGATFGETDESITHQIVDRPSIDKQYLSRYYIQPQWVYDCINFRHLLPVEDYFIGATLPPHISPFVTERPGDYVPPERKLLLSIEKGEEPLGSKKQETNNERDEEDEEEEEGDDIDEEEEEEDEGGQQEGSEEDDVSHKEVKKDDSQIFDKQKFGMKVIPGRVEVVDAVKMSEQEAKENYRFRELMIKKKHRRLYRAMKLGEKERQKEANRLQNKRDVIEKRQKQGNKRNSSKNVQKGWNVKPIADAPPQAKKLKGDTP